MMVGSVVPKVLWREVVVTATYIVNRTASCALGVLPILTKTWKTGAKGSKVCLLRLPEVIKDYRLWARDQ